MLTEALLHLDKSKEFDYLFDKHGSLYYENTVKKTLVYIQQYLSNPNFYSGEAPSTLKKQVENAPITDVPLSLDATLEELKSNFLDHAVTFQHPQYVAHLNCPVTIPSLAGDMIASAVNTAVETFDQSTSAAFIEQQLVAWIGAKLGYDEQADGIFTSGGSQSNFMALLMARDHKAFELFQVNLKEDGWHESVSKFRIFCSEKAHFSIQKNAALLGLGYHAVIPIATNNEMEMDIEALEGAILSETTKGNIPIAVVATLGTTDYGSFDPLESISSIAEAYHLWLHIDGAYGGCYVITDSHQHYFSHAHKADSITIDFHKTFYQPVCSSLFLLKNKQHFQYVSHFADYLNPKDESNSNEPDLIEKSIQTTRRFDALKLWFTLKVMGANTIASYLTLVHELAKEAYQYVEQKTLFECIHQPTLSTLVFRFVSPTNHDTTYSNELNLFIKDSLWNTGKASVASTKHEGKIYLKFTLLNPRTTIQDLKKIVEMIEEKGIEFITK